MNLPEQLEQSARACEGAALALTHALRPTATGDSPPPHVVDTFQEAQAFAITCRAVMDEATPLRALLAPDAPIVGKQPSLILLDESANNRVCNGFDTLAVVLLSLFDAANVAILEVAANHSRWIVPPLQASVAFERMVTHHGQLRGMYGIMHLAAKITRYADLSQTLFVDVKRPTGNSLHSDDQHEIDLDPGKWRAAIKMDDFYGREFGFHYTPEMRNVLRVINIARGSVHKSHQEDDSTPQVIKNVNMLGWGWIYSNMVLMNNLGISIDGVTEIGADNRRDQMTIQKLRKFMNLVEEPLVAGVSGLASADVAIDTTFNIPPPGHDGGIDTVSTDEHDALHDVFVTIDRPVHVRVISHKTRPIDLSSALPRRTRTGDGAAPLQGPSWNPEREQRMRRSVRSEDMNDESSSTKSSGPMSSPNERGGQTSGAQRKNSRVFERGSKVGASGDGQGAEVRRRKSGIGVVVAEVADQSYLASTIKTELRRLQSNVSNLLGIEEAKAGTGLIMHFHGGGFVSQSSTAHAVYTREWCADIPDAVLVSVDYRLAPEQRFPTAVHECLYAYVWAVRNAERLGTRAERVVFTGDSAGGNLAIATGLLAGRLGVRAPDGMCIAYPSLYLRMAWSASRLLSFFDPMLPLSVLELCVKSYIPEDGVGSADEEALISPVVASDDELRRLGPMAMICGSLDPLLDDAVSFAHRLRALRDGDVLRIFEKMPHGFLNLNLVNDTARAGMRFMASMIAEYLDVPLRAGSRAAAHTATDAAGGTGAPAPNVGTAGAAAAELDR